MLDGPSGSESGADGHRRQAPWSMRRGQMPASAQRTGHAATN